MTELTSAVQSSTIPSREVDAILERGIQLVRERSADVLNAVDDGVYVLDRQGHTIFANEAAVRMLGYTLREMLGRSQHSLIHSRHGDGSPFPVEECPIYLSVNDGVYQRVGGDVFWRKDGRKLIVDYTSTPIKEGRSIVASVVTFRDATDQERAAEQSSVIEQERAALRERDKALLESELGRQLLEQVLDAVPGPVSIMLGEDHRITLLNAKARALIGNREIIGQTVGEAFPELADQQASELLDRVYQTGDPYKARDLAVRWRRTGRDEPERGTFDVSYLPVRDAEGQIIGVLIYASESPAR
jgi:PAS domain S-box-containing protein